ncbi:hypothetical protein [Sphingomonas sp.]|uniref:hypothetical protein n=1 Tax=Sphingomonas sp. TaxID=28214 RepID=UPI0025D0E614|nr:hypothetical protein [Sphingomonas sp.]
MTNLPRRSQVALMVKIDGIPCRLVGAKDRGDKGVIFSPYSSINLEDGDRNLPIREEHVTAWPNEHSKKVQIHHTYHLKNDETWKVDHSTLADNSAGDFAAAIFAASIPLRRERQPFVVKSKYDVVYIPPYSAQECTLIVSYTVATLEKDFPNLRGEGIGLFELHFSKMKIGVYYTYLSLTSIERGRVSHMSTSMMRVNNGDVAHCAGPIPHVMADLAQFVKMQITSVIGGYMGTIFKDLSEAGINQAELRESLNSDQVVNTEAPLSVFHKLGIKRFGTLKGEFQTADVAE